ncbi:thyrostimulin beta-5 subunit [Condylostylus longicornis]|uniref:thyrostimulin beta-5 subunit n=1 Tax=Condylostylus longicornis TaxID=2530218 RepID=UPI00244DBF53|nr:thyrostimulin beta-5 subunit [Condylostylus longicornis]
MLTCSEIGTTFFSILLLLITTKVFSIEVQQTIIDSAPTKSALGCHTRLYTYRVSQTDSQGRECWDYVSVMSCWGRCDSSEISDWKFPYKKSFHPVCVHAHRTKAFAILRHCHPDVEPETNRYEYLEAKSCHCHTCSSTDNVSCEGPTIANVGGALEEKPGIKILALRSPDSDDLEYKK